MRLDRVCASLGKRRILERVTFSADPGELIFLTGRTGAGKTSLLRVMTGEIRVESGELWVAGFHMTPRTGRSNSLRRLVGVVFQDYGLIPWMTALENVEFAHRITHVWESGRQTRERATEALETVGLTGRMRAVPHELSGGEQQRVALARAVVSRPPIVLADEPTGNLDQATSLEMLGLLEQVASNGALVIVATHDRTLLEAGHRRLHLAHGRMAESLQMESEAS